MGDRTRGSLGLWVQEDQSTLRSSQPAPDLCWSSLPGPGMVSYPFSASWQGWWAQSQPRGHPPTGQEGWEGMGQRPMRWVCRCSSSSSLGRGSGAGPARCGPPNPGGPGRLCGLTPPRVGTCTRAQTRRPAGEPQRGRARAGLGWHHWGARALEGVTKTKTAPGRRPCRGLRPGQANTQTQRHRGYKRYLGLLLSRANFGDEGPKATMGPCTLQDWESQGPNTQPPIVQKSACCAAAEASAGGQGGVGTLGYPSACEGRARLPQGTRDDGWGWGRSPKSLSWGVGPRPPRVLLQRCCGGAWA